MSLLIKALEQAARQREGGKAPRPVQPPDGAREPLARAPLAAVGVSEAPPLRLEPVAGTPVSAPELEEQRARAAAVLQAGSGSRAALLEYLRANRAMAMLAAAGLLVLAYGIYFYLQLSHPTLFVRPAAPPASSPVAAPAAAPAQPAPELEAALIMPLTVSAPADTPLAVALAGQAPPPSATPVPGVAPAPPQASPAPSAPAPLEPRVAGEPIPTAALIAGAAPPAAISAPPVEQPAQAVRQARALPPEPPRAAPAEPQPAVLVAPARERINIRAGSSTPALHPQVELGYAALQAGRLEDARALYAEVMGTEPLNVDALLGLAYIAARQHRSDEALAHYLRILQIEPRHTVAQAALIALMGRADPAAAEARLKQLIAAEPSAFLHFVLGNLYADQQLWPQAQQAYFQAHHLEPGNPDYAYNLAVGLDHLRQRKLALTYYRRAAELAGGRAQVNFSIAHTRERIASLSAELE